MKKKHVALYSLIIVFLSAGMCILYFMTDTWKLSETMSKQSGFRPPALFPEPTTGELQAIYRLFPKLKTLKTPATTADEPVDLRLFGFTRAVERTGRKATPGRSKTKEPDKPEYTLSLVFSAGGNRFCILNGRFHREGDLLSDGSRIVQIDRQQILLDKHGLRNWIQMDFDASNPSPKKTAVR